MKKTRSAKPRRSTASALTGPGSVRYVLRLYVAGASTRSREALWHLRQLRDTELKGRYDLQVIDIYQQPIFARDGQIIATPTLVREFPRPMRRLIGNLANTPGLLAALELDTRSRPKP